MTAESKQLTCHETCVCPYELRDESVDPRIFDRAAAVPSVGMHSQPIPRTDPKRALIIVADAHGNTMRVAQALGVCLRRRGHIVDVGDALATSMPAPTDYAAVILGAELGRARDRRAIGDYILRYRDKLERIATGLFVLGGARDRIASRRYVEAFGRAVSWRPDFSTALPRMQTQYVRALFRRVLVSSLRRLSGSHNVSDADDEVADLANAIAREVRARTLRSCPYKRVR